MDSTPKKRISYSAFGLQVRLGGELVATARTPNMARRLAFALNHTRDQYSASRNKKEILNDGKHSR
jgi:hypothetical protein